MNSSTCLLNPSTEFCGGIGWEPSETPPADTVDESPRIRQTCWSPQAGRASRSGSRTSQGMTSSKPGLNALRFHPLTPNRWPDLERLFGNRGACGGCWCMWWRLSRSEFEKAKGEGNRRAFRRIVASGSRPGLLAYAAGEPIAWCAVGPRGSFPVLDRSRILAPVDDEPVWSVTCFFVARPYRRKRITVRLLEAAAEFARRRGAKILEGYPVEVRSGNMPDAFAWTGLVGAFRAAGFSEVARRSKTRPIMRLLFRATRANRTRG